MSMLIHRVFCLAKSQGVAFGGCVVALLLIAPAALWAHVPRGSMGERLVRDGDEAEGVTQVQPIFPCSPRLDNPYGVCTHVTRPWMNYPLRDREMELSSSVGVGWLRSDFDFATAFRGPVDFHPEVFDSVLAACAQHGQEFLPILTWMRQMPWDDPHYAAYVDSLALHYRGRITHWEMMNEVNLMSGIDSLPERYARSLQVTSERLHQADPHNQVLLSGLGEVKDDFLEQLCQLGAMRWVDVMNFHSYFRPEELLQCFAKIRLLMDRYDCHMPVWLTECGMHTSLERQEASGFYLQMLPAALRRIGIDERRSCVGYLADRRTGYVTLSDRQVQAYLTPVARQVQAVRLDELAALRVQRVPVLVATTDEYFPAQYFPALVDYVRRGGTIVLAGGMPFYYDAALPSNTWFGRKEMGTSLYAQLHMSPVQRWDDPATGEALTDTPPVVRHVPEHTAGYCWQIDDRSPARYLTADLLQPGDSLLPLITAGTEHRQEAVAGIYRLRSDLQGNIVFQTRMYAHPLPDKEDEQARRVARVYLLALAHGVERVFWYNLRAREQDAYDPEDCFGLIHADFAEKPSMQAYRTLTHMLPSGSTRPQLAVRNHVYEARWTRPDGCRVTALWSPYERVLYRLPRHRHLRLLDHMGRTLPQTSRRLWLTDAVTYLLEGE